MFFMGLTGECLILTPAACLLAVVSGQSFTKANITTVKHHSLRLIAHLEHTDDTELR